MLWLFSDAQIVHIIRDGRDCVASMKEADWFRGHIDKGISSWVRGMAAAERVRNKDPHTTTAPSHRRRARPLHMTFADVPHIREIASPTES